MPEIPVITLSRNSVRVGDDFVSRFAALLGGYFAGEPVDFLGRLASTSTGATPFQLSLVTAPASPLRAARRDNHVRRARRAGGPPQRRPVRRERSARRTASAPDRPVPPRRRGRRPRLVRLARPPVQAANSSSSREPMSLSEDLRNELAAITPRRECDVLAELSGLAHTAGTVHLPWAAGASPLSISTSLARLSPAAASACFAASRDSRARSARTRSTPSDRPTRYQLHVPGVDPMRSRCCTRPVSSPLATRSAGAAARSVSSPGACCRGSVPPRGACSARGSLSGPAVAAPGDPLCLCRRRRVPHGPRSAREDVELRAHRPAAAMWPPT